MEVRDEETGCSGVCCDVSCVKANQPTSTKALAVSRRPGKGKGHHVWSVSPSWFGKYPWLSMCERTGLLFCFYCTTAQKKQILTVSTKADPSFTRVGFSNWKKALHCFSKHESSHSHFEAVMKVKTPPNIGAMLDKNCKQQQRSRQQMLLKQLSSLKYLTSRV